MRLHCDRIAVSVAMALLLTAAGCGDSEEANSQKPASIEGAQGENTPSVTPQTAGGQLAPNQPTVDPQHPVVRIDTSVGSITVRLDRENVPRTVDNFLAYVDRGHYSQTIFHQVLSDFPKLIIGGAYTPQRTEKPTEYPILNEAHKGPKNTRGTIAMARRDDVIDSATCHFFLNLSDNDVLDHKDMEPGGYGYCVFGKITAGIEVADAIAAVEVHDTDPFERIPVESVVIKSIRRIK